MNLQLKLNEASMSSCHIPIRMCVICRRKFSKSKLFRIVLKESVFRPDPKGCLAGRGAYLCDEQACWLKARQSNCWQKAFRVKNLLFDLKELDLFYENNIKPKNSRIYLFG